MINLNLAKERNLSPETIEDIEFLHCVRDNLNKLRLTKKVERALYLKAWTSNEYLLQTLWGFSKDAAYHRFWDAEGCTCPKLDNDDAYPTGYYIINQDCPLHGVDNGY